jgi:lysophospholipase-3
MTFGVPIVPHDYVQPVQVNATSGAWLAPHPLAFGSEPVVSTPGRNYTAADLPAVLDVLGETMSQAAALLRKARNGGELDLEKLQRPPAGVPVHNWISNGIRTPRRFVYDRDLSRGFDRAEKEIVYGDGDGIANEETLRAPEKWPTDASAPVETRVFSGVKHQDLLFDTRVHEALLSLLRGPDERDQVVLV